MKIIAILLAIIMATYLIGGLIASIYSLWSGRNWDTEPLFGMKYFGNKLVFSGAFLAIMLILSEGIKPLLFFIPNSWGSIDEYGDWNSVKEQWSFFLALGATIFLFVYVRKAEEEKRKLKKNSDRAREDQT